MSPSRAILSLGSNLGDREAALRSDVADIGALDGVSVVAASGIVQTAAVKPGGIDADAPAYLNAVVEVSTSLEPLELLAALNTIESAHGRERVERWGDRTLDIDIVTFDDLVIDSAELSVPHPRAAERVFVLAPWLQVDPFAQLGDTRVDVLLAALDDAVAAYPAEPLT